MSKRDTKVCRITNSTSKEIEKWRKKISKNLGIELDKIKWRHGEVALRLSAKRGNVKLSELKDILIGKLKWNANTTKSAKDIERIVRLVIIM